MKKYVPQPQTEKNIGFLDAPVSGGQAGAENGQLTLSLPDGLLDVYL